MLHASGQRHDDLQHLGVSLELSCLSVSPLDKHSLWVAERGNVGHVLSGTYCIVFDSRVDLVEFTSCEPVSAINCSYFLFMSEKRDFVKQV